MPIRLPGNKPLSAYDAENLIPEGIYELHISSQTVDEINEQLVIKTQVTIDGVPSYGNQKSLEQVGKKFEHTFWVTTNAMFILRQLCDALSLPESVLSSNTFDPNQLLNKPFIAEIQRWTNTGGFTRNRLRIGTFEKSTHELRKMPEIPDVPDTDNKSDLPF